MVSKHRTEVGSIKNSKNKKKIFSPINILDNNRVYHFATSSRHLDHLFRAPMMGLETISFRIRAARMFFNVAFASSLLPNSSVA